MSVLWSFATSIFVEISYFTLCVAENSDFFDFYFWTAHALHILGSRSFYHKHVCRKHLAPYHLVVKQFCHKRENHEK